MRTLEDFAKEAGVIIHRCEKTWGGTYGYSTKDNPNCSINGYRSEAAAYKRWAATTFGEHASKALIKLLKGTQCK
jgi:hypothetical protein